MSSDNIFNLSVDELALARSKNTNKNKLIFGVLLKYFQLEGHYPKDIKYIDPIMLNSIANQLDVLRSLIEHIDFEGRSTERFRQEIRCLLGYRKATLKDITQLKSWLMQNIFPRALKKQQNIEFSYEYFRANNIEPFTSKELERHINSVHKIFEAKLFQSIFIALPKEAKESIDFLLSDKDIEGDEHDNTSNIKFKHLKQDVSGAKLKDVILVVEKVNFLIQLKLPVQLLSQLSIKLVNKYYTRVMAELPGSRG